MKTDVMHQHLIIHVGCTDNMHSIASYYAQLAKTYAVHEAMETNDHCMRTTGHPILF